MANEVQLKKNVGDQAIERINNLCDAGFNMPADYNFVNAIKMSMLKLQELKDKNGKKALDVCTKASISTALFKMATKGLNVALNQGYFLVRGDVLCFQESYFGNVLMVKRIYPDWNPKPVVIHEGDEFIFGIDETIGKRHVVKHEQKLENIDKDFIGGYLYLPDGDLYLMTKKQILTAWSKSSSKEQSVHKSFTEKMVAKTLINSGCTMVINSTPQYNVAEDDNTQQTENSNTQQSQNFEEFEEAEVVEEVSEETGEVKKIEEPKEVEEAPKVEDEEF